MIKQQNLKLFYKLNFLFIRKNIYMNDYLYKLKSRKRLLFFLKPFKNYNAYDKNNYMLTQYSNFLKNYKEKKNINFYRTKQYFILLELYTNKIYFYFYFKRLFFYFFEIYRYTFSFFFLLKKRHNNILYLKSKKEKQKRKIFYFSFLKNKIYKMPIYHLYFSFDFFLMIFDYYRTSGLMQFKKLSFYFKIIFFYKYNFFHKLLYLKR